MLKAFSLFTIKFTYTLLLFLISIQLASHTGECTAVASVARNVPHGRNKRADLLPNRSLPQHPDSLPEVTIRLHTTLPRGPVETSITLYPTRLSAFTVSKGVAFLPHEWGVWGAEVLDGPFMAKRREAEADRLLLRPTESDEADDGGKSRELEERAVMDSERDETTGLDDDYRQGDGLLCNAAGFQRMKYELDFTLRDSWGVALWEIECWVPRKGRLRRWWESLWSR